MLGELKMRILYFTDTHIRGTTPKNRKDDYPQTLENKFMEILKIIKDKNVDFVIHGGDLFDRPDISVSVVSRFANILNQIKVPIYMVSGNHDIYGHNPQTVNRTMVGLLNSLGIINIIDDLGKIILEKDNIKVQLTGQPYIYNIDDINNRSYYLVDHIDPGIDYSIHLVHGMLLDKPFIKGIPYTLIDDIKTTKADITLSGHYHSGYKKTIIDNKYFINPGSIVRITNSLREMERQPQVALIDLEDQITINFIPLLTAGKGEDILDRDEIERNIFQRERLFEFKQTVDDAIDFEKMNINDLLIEVSTSEGVSEDVKIEALRRISLIQMKGLNGD
jgi:DNA repair exonuclease SbcCD nuclease subunit